jgi:putative transposase
MEVKHVHISAQRKHTVKLLPEEKTTLQTLLHKGTIKARIITRARILLLADQGKTDATICESLSIVRSVVYDVRKHYVTGGLNRALYDLPRPGQKRKLTGLQEAEVVAIACTKAPKGYSRWTLDLLTEEVNKRLSVSIGRTAIWKVLLRNDTKPWLKKNMVYSKGYS